MPIERVFIRASLQKKLGINFDVYKDCLERFIKEPLQSGFKLEKLQGKNQPTYSIRYNEVVRLILNPVATDKGQVWVMSDVLEHHEYGDAKALSKEEEAEIKHLLESELSQARENTESRVEVSDRVEYINGQFIVFDDSQEEIKQGVYPLPLIISGAPGSGKTSVLLLMVKQRYRSWHEEKGDKLSPRILLLTKSPILLEEMEREWGHICKLEFDGVIEGVEFKTPEMLYREQHPGKVDFKEERDFIIWYEQDAKKQRQVGKNGERVDWDASLIYQEFYSMSGYEKLEDYEGAVSSKFSLFSEQETRFCLWRVYENYRDKLRRNQEVDLAFHPIKLLSDYDLVGVDETQDLSRAQNKSLIQGHHHDNFVFNVGDHQRLFGSETTLPFLRSMFWDKHRQSGMSCQVTHKVLKASYRCSQKSAQVANAVLQLKYRAIGGSPYLDKNELVYICSQKRLNDTGSVQWLEKPEELEFFKNNKDNVEEDFVVITSETLREEAIGLFGRHRVFTSKCFKGLQAKQVLLYQFMLQEGFKAANLAIDKDFILQDPPTSVVKESTSNSSIRHGTLFNELFVATTRAEGSLFIYQPARWEVRFIINPLKTFILKHNKVQALQSTAVHVSSKEAWVEREKECRKDGQTEKADAIKKSLEPQNKTHSLIINKTKPAEGKHVLNDVLESKRGAINRLITDENVFDYFFNTMLNQINSKLSQESFMVFLQRTENEKIKSACLAALNKRLEEVSQWKKPNKTQQQQQDAFMVLLYHKYSDSPQCLAISLIPLAKNNPASQNFLKNFRKTRHETLCQQVFNGDSQAIISLQQLELINETLSDGEKLVHRVVMNKKFKMLPLLKKAGADINQMNEKGDTPLQVAILSGQTSAIKTLVEFGADINQPNRDGYAPLYFVVLAGDVEAIKTLVALKADVNQLSQDGILHFMLQHMEGILQSLKCW